ncbi:hypothetical protein OIT44_07280 [Weissella ceti]|uniref:Major facilitator superfamily (MFS) profile domain-containing protein n=1 Tax=Weissella ceti TaxID=759620 RepID=A0ABT3E608_9LACO|nr:hypothetical protein [Weissella ceti]MCW0953851.1 hypothetical protein [Weissella ceti]QVK11652.1 hypothetical protein KHQ31_05365 [Weissella ceti]
MDKNYKTLLIAAVGTVLGIMMGQFFGEGMFWEKLAIGGVIGYIIGYILYKFIPEKD